MTQKLNPQQQEAVNYQNGPLLILAGAGTGKTRVLTQRIIYIINSYLAHAQQILAVTFTNKAAAEMKQRIYEEIGDLAHNIWMGTFHSVATRILKRHPEVVGLKSDFTIIDSDDSLRLLRQITKDLGVDGKDFPAKNYQYQIERLKDKALLPENLSNSHKNHLPHFVKVYEIYQNRLLELNCADFGDLLLYNLQIFKKEPETLVYYQNKFEHILVDEYQDTNNCQYQWLLLLGQAAKKIKTQICAVGDDDQSIYSWRGAQVANILRFEKDFIDTKIIRLEQNYRSSENILKAASHLIDHNTNRHKKTLWTDQKGGHKVQFTSFLSDRMEADGVGNFIRQIAKNDDLPLKNMAILVRAGYQTRVFEEIFMQNNLPYRIIGGLRFYDRREIKDAIAYLRITQNFTDDLALQRIINLPKRGVGIAGMAKINNRAQSEKSSLFSAVKRSADDGLIKGKAKSALTELVQNIENWHSQIADLSLPDLAQQILEQSGYANMWRQDKTPEAASRIDNLQEFINSLADFENLSTFLDHVSLVGDGVEKANQEDMVNIMTVHSAKGLEFDVVFIPGLEDGVFPSGRAAAEENGLEEERRLLYVAMTRARKQLFLSCCSSRFTFGQIQQSIPSPFLSQLPTEIIENIGSDAQDNFVTDVPVAKTSKKNFLKQRVFHQKFGYGRILEIDGEKLKIKFEKGDIKILMSDFVKVA